MAGYANNWLLIIEILAVAEKVFTSLNDDENDSIPLNANFLNLNFAASKQTPENLMGSRKLEKNSIGKL